MYYRYYCTKVLIIRTWRMFPFSILCKPYFFSRKKKRNLYKDLFWSSVPTSWTPAIIINSEYVLII